MSKATIAALAFLTLATTRASAQQFDQLSYLLQPQRSVLAADPTPIPLTLEEAQAKVSRKEPALAFLLSFVLTGAGQAYNGQWGKGALMLGGAFASLIVAAVGATDCILDALNTAQPSCGLFAVGVIAATGFVLWSWIDAPLTASKLNKKNGLALEIGPRLQPLALSAGSTRAFALAGIPRSESRRFGVSLARVRF